MLNPSVRAGAGTSQKAKWRFDRETGEWVCDTPPPAPQPDPPQPVLVIPPATPAAPVAWSTSQNGPGLAYVAPAVFNVAVTAPVAVPASPVAAPKPKRNARDLLHLDVVLPVVAALIVLILFLAWAA